MKRVKEVFLSFCLRLIYQLGQFEGEAKKAQGVVLKIAIFCVFWETNAAQ